MRHLLRQGSEPLLGSQAYAEIIGLLTRPTTKCIKVELKKKRIPSLHIELRSAALGYTPEKGSVRDPCVLLPKAGGSIFYKKADYEFGFDASCDMLSIAACKTRIFSPHFSFENQ